MCLISLWCCSYFHNWFVLSNYLTGFLSFTARDNASRMFSQDRCNEHHVWKVCASQQHYAFKQTGPQVTSTDIPPKHLNGPKKLTYQWSVKGEEHCQEILAMHCSASESRILVPALAQLPAGITHMLYMLIPLKNGNPERGDDFLLESSASLPHNCTTNWCSLPQITTCTSLVLQFWRQSRVA